MFSFRNQPLFPKLVAGGLIAASLFILLAFVVGPAPWLYGLLDAVFVIGILTAALTAPFLFLRWVTPKVIFGVAVVSGLLAAASSESVGQFEVQQLLASEPPSATVSISGHPVQNSAEVLAALKELRDLPAHHSSPAHKIQVDIYGQSHLVLWLARDSSNPREYWVMYPRHFITKSNEIGRIITPLFDAY